MRSFAVCVDLSRENLFVLGLDLGNDQNTSLRRILVAFREIRCVSLIHTKFSLFIGGSIYFESKQKKRK